MTKTFTLPARGAAAGIDTCECGGVAVLAKEIDSEAPILRDHFFVQCTACGHTNKRKQKLGEVAAFCEGFEAIEQWNEGGYLRKSWG